MPAGSIFTGERYSAVSLTPASVNSIVRKENLVKVLYSWLIFVLKGISSTVKNIDLHQMKILPHWWHCHLWGYFVSFNSAMTKFIMTYSALQWNNTENSKQKFPEKELRGHSPNFHILSTFVFERIPTIDLPILLQENMWMEIGTEAAQFPE